MYNMYNIYIGIYVYMLHTVTMFDASSSDSGASPETTTAFKSIF